MTKRLILAAAFLLLSGAVRAGEGMWLVTDPAKAGAEAVVSMDFIGTGSIISADGLLITNHHVAYGDLAALGLLENGFCAASRDEEIRVSGKKVQILRKMVDVTAEVAALRDSLTGAGVRFGSRKLAALMERRHGSPGMEVSLHTMWAGEQYYIAYYDVYEDVRLVLAPPASIASFGGDEDNWEWPQHKADFTLYRIYENGRPLSTPQHLKLSTAGLRDGDYARVIGYPGRTRRYSSSFELAHQMTVQWPGSSRLAARRMEIIRKWMDADPLVRSKYSEIFFSLSNLQEFQAGELDCSRRFGIVARKETQERELAAWIAADSVRQLHRGRLLEDMREAYSGIARSESLKVLYRETLIRGTTIAPALMRMHNDRRGRADSIYAAGLAATDGRVEKELLAAALSEYFGGMDEEFIGQRQRTLHERFGSDWNAFASWLWEHPHDFADFITEVRISAFPTRDMSEMRQEFTRALYEMRLSKGIRQYPDANSTLRLSEGEVCGLSPRDAVRYSWFSSARGIFEKADPQRHDFAVPEDFLALLKEYGDPVNFLTDLDISGGNSGSPVLNRKGELVGLAFDGNQESLASDYFFLPEYNRCVCVDIRYILFIIRRYYGRNDLLAEILA